MAIHAWLDSRDEQQRLASTLTAQKQLLDAADSRERTRQSALDATLAQIEALKRATQTPEQILRELPKYLSLPQPITLAPAQQGSDDPTRIVVKPKSAAAEELRDLTATTLPTDSAAPENRKTTQPRDLASSSPARIPAQSPATLPTAPAAQIPSADLKPLYDYVQDCRACQAQLAAAKQNQLDDAAKLAALTRERDAAVTAAKGGTFWRRFRHNAKWLAVGAALGAAAGYAASR